MFGRLQEAQPKVAGQLNRLAAGRLQTLAPRTGVTGEPRLSYALSHFSLPFSFFFFFFVFFLSSFSA